MKNQYKYLLLSLPFILLFGIRTIAAVNGPNPVSVTSIANEGVLITSNNTQIIVDGLYENVYPQFDTPTSDQIDTLLNSDGDIKTNIMLITHKHGDHFSAKLTAEFLKAGRDNIAVGPQQVIDEVTQYATENDISFQQNQTLAINPSNDSSVISTINEVTLTTFRFDHENEQFKNIENNVYLLEVEGQRILHIGDAKMSFEPFQTKLASQEIDLSILPFWFISNDIGNKIINEHLNKSEIVLAHIHTKHHHRNNDEVYRHEFQQSAIGAT